MNSLTKWISLKHVIGLKIQTPQVRYYMNKPYVRRFGYKEKVLIKGLLPRDKTLKPITQIPQYKPKNAWAEKRALFGQNDYIDILGDGNIHPSQLLSHVPYWLRGFRGNEYQTAIRKMKFMGEHWSHMRPKKFVDLAKRLKYLHYYFNNNKQN